MVQCEAPKVAKLLYNSNVTMVYGTYNELVTGANLNQLNQLITGGAHIDPCISSCLSPKRGQPKQNSHPVAPPWSPLLPRWRHPWRPQSFAGRTVHWHTPSSWFGRRQPEDFSQLETFFQQTKRMKLSLFWGTSWRYHETWACWGVPSFNQHTPSMIVGGCIESSKNSIYHLVI